MKLLFVISAAGLLLSGTLTKPLQGDSKSGAPATTNPTIISKHKPKMWVDKPNAYKGEAVQLFFEMPHAQYLGVVNPAGQFFYVVFPAENASQGLQPLVSSERFVTLKNLNFNTATLKCDPYIYGIMENQPVFTQSGIYRFILGENLHVDDANSLAIVKINYYHEARAGLYAQK